MSTTTTALHSLLRGELSAVETYDQALKKLEATKAAPELRRIRGEHQAAADAWRQHLEDHGERPDAGSGAWGAFARAVEGTATFFGAGATLKALKEGEEHGLKQYQAAMTDASLSHTLEGLITEKLIPQIEGHIRVLDRLMNGLVERITPEEVRWHRAADSAALLVCAYDDQEKCAKYHIDGSITLAELKLRESSLPRNTELIFYCA
jgi:hypothetical protein